MCVCLLCMTVYKNLSISPSSARYKVYNQILTMLKEKLLNNSTVLYSLLHTVSPLLSLTYLPFVLWI